MLKICCFLTGDDYNLLKNNTPKSRKKIFLYSTALLIPVITWAILGFMIVSIIKGAGIASGIVASILCGTIVFALERIILMSEGNRFLTFLRITLGIAIAILGGAFVNQILFKDEIVQELDNMKKEAKDNAFFIASQALSLEINKGTSITDNAKNLWLDAQDRMLKESDASGGTGKAGIGEVTMLKAEVSKRLEDEYLKEKESLTQLKQTYFALREKTNTNIEASYPSGALLIRFEALHRVLDKNKMATKYYLIISFILLIMEFVVVMVKYSCKKTSYDRLLEMQEYVSEKKAKHFMSEDSMISQMENLDSGLSSIRQKLLVKKTGMFN